MTFPDQPRNLARALAEAGRRAPARGITLVDNRGRDRERRTWCDVLDASRLAARRLRGLGVVPGDRVVLSLPTSWEWLDCWFGAVLLGAVPCATPTPGALGSPTAHLEKLLRVVHRIGARMVLAPEPVVGDLRVILDGGFAERSLGEPVSVDLVSTERLAGTAPGTAAPDIDSDACETAYLQLTSGSTGLPRAVELSHRGAVHNALACAEGVAGPHGEPAPPSTVSWLPLYHDMGLVGCLLQTLVTGGDLHLMSPRTFLGRPRLWLERVGRLDRAMSPAPNFAYQLCVERLREEEIRNLELGRFRDAVTGSEMVRPETFEAFCSRFAKAGFQPQRVRPAYGLAEATLAVTLDRRLEGLRSCRVPEGGPRELQSVASNGSPLRDTRVEIRAPDGAALPPHSIGEVWVSSPGVMKGYLGDPVATAEVLRDGWLDTGDLGFLDADGELYITGRKKEILILQGQNLMPHELEWVAEGVAGGGGAERGGAFSVPAAGGERAVLVLETAISDPERLRRLAHDVATAIGRSLGVPLADLVLVPRGTLPRTSSGKIQRTALRASYLAGALAPQRLAAAAGAPPATSLERCASGEDT
jgi:acyl-CoA synthetase (AMP-forming)/AMP-acid ligase II